MTDAKREVEPPDVVNLTETETANEDSPVGQSVTRPGEWKVTKVSRTPDEQMQAIIVVSLIALVGVVVTAGAILFVVHPSADLGEYTTRLLTPLVGLTGISVGYFFGRRS